MARRDTYGIYDKNHTIQVFNRNGFSETRSLNVNITDFHDSIQVKLRDACDFVFNYTAKVDLRYFEVMRSEQSLDIDFNDLKTNLLDMLQQVLKQEMFLKCEIDQNRCKLIFYGKSKIKSIIFLAIDLQITNQKEIFDEMNASISELQSINQNLNTQLQNSKRNLFDKDAHISQISQANKQLEKQFLQDLRNVSLTFAAKLQECSDRLMSRILNLTRKLLKLLQNIETVKAEAHLKAASSARLLQSMEHLRLDLEETTKTLNDIKRENCNLKTIQYNNETTVAELQQTIERQRDDFMELQSLKDELETDVKQAAKIIAQKTTANEELAKDVVQANQMLVNFNHLFDTKNQEIEDLKQAIAAKDSLLQEQNHRFRSLLSEFEDYKVDFNQEQHTKLSQELYAASKRIEEVEKLNRETIKLNELLTRKLASGDYTHRTYHH